MSKITIPQITGVIILLAIGILAGRVIEKIQHQCYTLTFTDNTFEAPLPPIDIRNMTVTAYCPCEKCCGKWADGITASGHVIKKGDKFVAADRSIAFGTTIDIPGYGEVPVLDRGGAIEGDRLDVYFSTHQEALNWGVKNLKVRIEKCH